MSSHGQNCDSVLIVDVNRKAKDMCTTLLEPSRRILFAKSTKNASAILEKEPVSVLVCSEDLPSENGLMYMSRVNKKYPLIQLVLMSEGINDDLVSIAINDMSAPKYLRKPVIASELVLAIEGALRNYKQVVELERLKDRYKKIHREMQGIPYRAKRAQHTTRVLIHNSKELVATACVSITVVFGMSLFLGLVVLTILYTVKTLFGIDIFADAHITDIFG